jgi:uracil-DNA glycosylase family 4
VSRKSQAPAVKDAEPLRDCPLCPRLAAFRNSLRAANPDWHNAPVPLFGADGARLLIVGLAPGLRGANRTGRPFTGDFAGELLYKTLIKSGLARGAYAASPADGLSLVSCAIANAVRCVPPQNKPLPSEAANCRPFLALAIRALAHLRVIVALGRLAHDSTLRALHLKPSAYPFAHGAQHRLATAGAPLTLIDSYHCSRYNTNTGVLTEEMFQAIFATACEELQT